MFIPKLYKSDDTANKLSQNTNDSDFENIILNIEKGNANEIKAAEKMKSQRK